MPRNRAFDIQAAQANALTFAREYISSHPFHLPEDMSEEQFSATMTAITQALVNSYAKGYLDATEGKGRR